MQGTIIAEPTTLADIAMIFIFYDLFTDGLFLSVHQTLCHMHSVPTSAQRSIARFFYSVPTDAAGDIANHDGPGLLVLGERHLKQGGCMLIFVVIMNIAKKLSWLLHL